MFDNEKQYGYAEFPLKPTDRRTCKAIKCHIRKTLNGFEYLKLTDEQTDAIVHDSFIRAIDRLENEGYLTTFDLINIVKEEYDKRHTVDYGLWFNQSLQSSYN